MTFADTTLAEIVTKFPAVASLFEKHDLDYCCRGKLTLKAACESESKLKMMEEEISTILENYRANAEIVDFESMPTQQLVDYIINTHHRYVQQSMPLILGHLHKIASKHGGRHSELLNILSNFTLVSEEMSSHMQKEEKILFPAILEMQNIIDTGGDVSHSSQLMAPIQVMEMEHETVGELLAEIRVFSNKYSPPATACMTYKLSFEELREFEEDLHKHVHLENNILFPRMKKCIIYDKADL